MSCKKVATVIGSVLLLAFATVTAWANDRIVSTVTITPRNSAQIVPEQGTISWSSDEGSAHSPLFEGAKWSAGSVITWSISNGPGTADAPFSGYMGAQYKGIVQQAFQTWASASSLSFVEVPDSPQSDIRLGWGTFNTSATGVVGHTAGLALSGQMLPGTIIRLEDPTQDPLVAGAGDILTYSGTNANFYQVVLHEIGHALGLADNNDPDSVMYAEATGANNSLAANDVAGIQTLYGSRTLSREELSTGASNLSGTAVIFVTQRVSLAAASIQADQTAVTSSPCSSVVYPSTKPLY